MLTSLEAIYTNYRQTLLEVRKKAKLFDGFFGLGKDPKKDPCHEAFYEAVGAWVADFVATEPSQGDILAVSEFLVRHPLQYRDKECYWFMFAAHGHLKPLIPLMDKATSLAVHNCLETSYGKADRMPLQKELLKTLKKNAK